MRLFSESDIGREKLLNAIDSEDLPFRDRERLRMAIQVPRELIQSIRDIAGLAGLNGQGRVRLGSFLYDNMDGLLPTSLPGRNEYVMCTC